MFDQPKRKHISEFDLPFTVWVLISWPPLCDLTHHEDSAHIIRICALLARRPSAGQLIPLVLHIPPETTYRLLSFLYAEGYICSLNDFQKQEQLDQLEAEPEMPADTASFLGKIWQKLLDKWRP